MPLTECKSGQLALSPSLMFGKGLDRECYIHPEDPSKCIKITVTNDLS